MKLSNQRGAFIFIVSMLIFRYGSVAFLLVLCYTRPGTENDTAS